MTEIELNAAIDKRLEDKMEKIAELAATKALNRVYSEIGKGVLKKAAWIVGVLILSLLMYLAGRGVVKFPTP